MSLKELYVLKISHIRSVGHAVSAAQAVELW